MTDLTERIQLTYIHRDLIFKYGYPFERLQAALLRWHKGQVFRRIRMSRFELDHLIGELSRSFNDNETKGDSDDVLELCEHLEYAERSGDGDLGIL